MAYSPPLKLGHPEVGCHIAALLTGRLAKRLSRRDRIDMIVFPSWFPFFGPNARKLTRNDHGHVPRQISFWLSRYVCVRPSSAARGTRAAILRSAAHLRSTAHDETGPWDRADWT